MFSIGANGELNEKFPALILGWCAISRFNGLVSFTVGSAKRDFYFFKGKILTTASNQPPEGAVACLVRSKVLTNDQYRAIYQSAMTDGGLPEKIARDRFGVMGGQLKDAQILSSRLLIRQMATSFTGGQYQCQQGVKPLSGAVLIEQDPLYDLISGLNDDLSEELARSWLSEHNPYLRTNNSTWGVIRPLLISIASRLKKPMVVPVSEIPAALAMDIVNILDIQARMVLILLALTALVLSEPQEGDQELERPVDADVQEIRDKIKEEYQRIKDMDLFALLGVPEDAKEPEIKAAYLNKAQEWHSDRFGNADLGTAAKALQAINAKINEAKETLLDEKKNETYRFVLDRTRQGLPTDVEVILKAEENYKRAELCIEQGKYQIALPLLEEAVSLNKGEADFWVNLALCRVAVNGAAMYDKAQEDLATAISLDKGVETKVLLTKGRIELLLEKYKEADGFFKKVLELQPNNEVAKKSQRLIMDRMSRQLAKETEKPKSLISLINGMKKK